MLGLKLSQLLPFIAIVFALLLQQFPHAVTLLMADSKAPSLGKPWADSPLKMVRTPMVETGKNDTWTKGASHMALLHNAVLRGFNSIYLQTPHVKKEDYADFIGYCLAWFKFVKSHHDDEEENLFPKVVEVLGKSDKEVWGVTHGEHEALLPPLAALNTYLTGLANPSALDPSHLTFLLDAIKEPLNTHFHSEIAIIASLSSLSSPQSTAPSEAAAPIFAAWGKATVTKAGYLDCVPFLFLNFDRTFEDGYWKDWPPMPKVILWALVRGTSWWHAGWWRFASCGVDGMPRELYALGEGKGL
ncbi:hypothetical protein BCR34DRAFT_569826 [Clohesyomyces aquaticus]|uniref:Hemerythrin-like domain-containing protein n=1 Tax=Clohesyomyces aquaticus TaxID=1231657 RepID=A0A1Y1ZE43_9PLEO|nr:hypothetical protein BCR34DRAFT_569826 [Clohesyomyces aquaticus]